MNEGSWFFVLLATGCAGWQFGTVQAAQQISKQLRKKVNIGLLPMWLVLVFLILALLVRD